MRLKGFLIFFFSLFCIYGAFAQAQGELTQSRILILLDESSSMIQKWPSGKEKYKAADELILHLMDSIYVINPDVEFSLRVFGHQYTVEQNNCYDTKNEVPFSKDNRVQMSLRLDDIRPLGVTPIAYALMQAAEYDLVDEEHNAYSIILFTDGGESCGGDICEVMNKLRKYKVYFKPYIVSLEDDATLKTTYSCMGDFLQVTKDADMPKAVTTIVNAFRPAIKITKADYKQIQTLAANVPSALKVNIPISNPNTDSGVIKKESEIPLPKPTKTFKDSNIAHVVKETVPVKPAPQNIENLIPGRHILLYTNVPATETLPLVTVPTVEIKMLPPAEPISRVTPAQPILSYVPVAKTNVIQPVEVPLIEIKILPVPEQISGIIPVRSILSHTPIAKTDALQPVAIPELKITVLPEPENISELTLAHAHPVSNVLSAPAHIAMVTPPATPTVEVPFTITPETISRAALSHLRPVAVSAPDPKIPNVRPVMPLPPPPPVEAPVEPVVVRKKEKISRLQTIQVETRRSIFLVDERDILPRKVPPLPRVKVDIPKTTVAKITPASDALPFKTTPFKVDVQDANETSVEVYLTDGHGKYYSSTPQMLLLEPGTNKVVKTFYRTVDAGGNPDPLTSLPAGTFNLSLSDKRTLGLSNVKIEKNKKNKITVTVPPASLSFAYADAPERPITEFVARVTERNKSQGRVQDQKCTQELEYADGNYHIMINTFPQIDRNTDIDFGETVITILQPGFVKFVHDDKIQLVVLYDQEGDKFLPFHTIDLKDMSTQPLRIQPGAYQAHYHSGLGGQYASEKVVPFIVKATMETTVELH